jgi:hypothetical protein
LQVPASADTGQKHTQQNQDFDDCWTMFGAPSLTGEYQQESINNSLSTHHTSECQRNSGCGCQPVQTQGMQAILRGCRCLLGVVHPDYGTWLLLMADLTQHLGSINNSLLRHHTRECQRSSTWDAVKACKVEQPAPP